jgi:hypothetical protein
MKIHVSQCPSGFDEAVKHKIARLFPAKPRTA